MTTGVSSTAAIAGHPIHPMLVVFPTGFLVGALGADLAFRGTGDPFRACGAVWLLGGRRRHGSPRRGSRFDRQAGLRETMRPKLSGGQGPKWQLLVCWHG
jgi:hypothetical protein